jgi:hypothetical protein
MAPIVASFVLVLPLARGGFVADGGAPSAPGDAAAEPR